MSTTRKPADVFSFTCPNDGARVEVEMRPERMNGLVLDVPSTFCPVCHQDITREARLAVNAPTVFVKHVLEHDGIWQETPSSIASGFFAQDAAFRDFLRKGRAVREIVQGAEYLSETERSILRDRYGFQTGRPLSYAAIGRNYHRSAKGVLEILRRVCIKVVAHSSGVLLTYFPQSETGGGQPMWWSRDSRTATTPQLVSVAEAAKMLGISRYRVYQVGGFDKAADPVADEPKGGWLVFACPLDRKPKSRRRRNSLHGTFFVTLDSVLRYRAAHRSPGPKGVNTRAWLDGLRC